MVTLGSEVALGVVVHAVLFLAFTAAARLLEKPRLAPWVRIGKPVDQWGDRGPARPLTRYSSPAAGTRWRNGVVA